MATDFELPAGKNDEEVLDALFGDDAEFNDEDFELMEEDVEAQAPPPPQPTPEPPAEKELNQQSNTSAELAYFREKNKLLTSQLEEVGLNPEMTDSERLEKLAAGGIESEYAQELIDTFYGMMSETGARNFVAKLVDEARAQRPDIKWDDEHPVAYELRVNKDLGQLNTWRNSNDPRFQKAIELDENLRNDPKYAQMSDTERFKVVQDMVVKGQTSPSQQTAVDQNSIVDYEVPNSFDAMTNTDIELELEKYADFL